MNRVALVANEWQYLTGRLGSREMLDFLPFVKSDFYFLPAHLSTCQKRSLSRVIQRAIT